MKSAEKRPYRTDAAPVPSRASPAKPIGDFRRTCFTPRNLSLAWYLSSRGRAGSRQGKGMAWPNRECFMFHPRITRSFADCFHRAVEIGFTLFESALICVVRGWISRSMSIVFEWRMDALQGPGEGPRLEGRKGGRFGPEAARIESHATTLNDGPRRRRTAAPHRCAVLPERACSPGL